MTSTEPMTYKPGPELDELIASKLFGFEVHESLPIMFEKPDSDFKSIPAYSTTWGGLGLVVDEMDRREWGFTLSYDGQQWLAAFLAYKEVPYAEADTAPHAVAEACLSALQHVSHTDGLGDRDEMDTE